MIDIDHLRTLDPTTKDEVLAEYHESKDYLLKLGISQLVSPAFAHSRRGQLDDEYLRQLAGTFTDPLAYYDTYIDPGRSIFRLVVTHPDMDHMSGLYRLIAQER